MPKITKRWESAADIRHLLTRVKKLEEHKGMERFNIPLLKLSSEGTIERVNTKAATSFSTPRSQLEGRHISDVLEADAAYDVLFSEMKKVVQGIKPGETVAMTPSLVMRKDPSGELVESMARFTVHKPFEGDPKIYASLTHTRRVLERSQLLREFFDIATKINSQTDLDTVLWDVAKHFANRFNAAAIVVKPDELDTNTLKIVAAEGKGINPIDLLKFGGVKVGEGLLGTAAETMKPLEVKNIQEWEKSAHQETDKAHNFKNSLAVPLTVKGSDGKPLLVGVIGLYKRGDDKFRPHERRMLEVLGANTATAIQNAKLTSELKRMAENDPLTGVSNRRVLYRDLRDLLNANPAGSHEFKPSVANKRFSIFFVDANNLKLLNDTFHHEAGDRGITTIADALAKHAPKDATVARVGGDEFVVLAPDVDMPHSSELKDKFFHAIQKHVRADDEMKVVNFGASIEYVHYGAGGQTRDDYANLYDLFQKHEKISAKEEHKFLDKLLELAEKRMKVVKALSKRQQLSMSAIDVMRRLAEKSLKGRMHPEGEKAVLEMIAEHAGPDVVQMYPQIRQGVASRKS